MSVFKQRALAVWKHVCHGPPVGVLGLTILVCLVVASPAQAVPHLLTDLNSTTTIEDGVGVPPRTGQISWVVDGTENIFQQWFWISSNPIGGPSVAEVPIDGLGLSAVNPFGNPPNKLDLVYGGPGGLQVDISYTLLGGTPGSGDSDLGELLRIWNNTAAPLEIHFFQYVDFDLGGTPGGDTVQIFNANMVQQTSGSAWVSEALHTTANHFELDFFPVTVGRLNDLVATTLGVGAGLGAGPVGPGDVTWAFQWDFTLAADPDGAGILRGGSFLISKDKMLSVPEPLTMAGLFLGITGLANYIRKRRMV